MLAKDAYGVIDDIECQRWSAECSDYAAIELIDGEYWLVIYEGDGIGNCVDKIDDPENVTPDDDYNIWA